MTTATRKSVMRALSNAGSQILQAIGDVQDDTQQQYPVLEDKLIKLFEHIKALEKLTSVMG